MTGEYVKIYTEKWCIGNLRDKNIKKRNNFRDTMVIIFIEWKGMKATKQEMIRYGQRGYRWWGQVCREDDGYLSYHKILMSTDSNAFKTVKSRKKDFLVAMRWLKWEFWSVWRRLKVVEALKTGSYSIGLKSWRLFNLNT